jgi:hypothetical protein
VRRDQLLAQAGDDRLGLGARRVGGGERRLQLAQLGRSRRELGDLRVQRGGFLAARAGGVERLLELRLEGRAFGLERRQRRILRGGALLGLGDDDAELGDLGLRRVGGSDAAPDGGSGCGPSSIAGTCSWAVRSSASSCSRPARPGRLEEGLGGDAFGGLGGALALGFVEAWVSRASSLFSAARPREGRLGGGLFLDDARARPRTAAARSAPGRTPAATGSAS